MADETSYGWAGKILRVNLSTGSVTTQPTDPYKEYIGGMGLANKQGERGDLYAQLKVVMPSQSDDATRELWSKLAQKAAFNPRTQWSN